jgi:hypothetical protein
VLLAILGIIIAEIILNFSIATLMAPAAKQGGLCHERFGEYDRKEKGDVDGLVCQGRYWEQGAKC